MQAELATSVLHRDGNKKLFFDGLFMSSFSIHGEPCCSSGVLTKFVTLTLHASEENLRCQFLSSRNSEAKLKNGSAKALLDREHFPLLNRNMYKQRSEQKTFSDQTLLQPPFLSSISIHK